MPEVFDESVRHQVLVEGYKSQQGEEYAALVLPLLFANFVQNLNELGVSRLNEVTLARVNRLANKIEKENLKSARKANRKFVSNLRDLAAEEVDFQQKSLRQDDLSPRAYTGKRAMKESMSTPVSADGSMLEETLFVWVVAYNARLKSLLRRSWTNGSTTQDVQRQVQGTVSRRRLDGMIGALTRKDIPGMVNNAIQHVSSVSRMAVMRLTPGVAGYRWVSILDNRTSNVCRSLDGRVFEFGNGPRPPIHWNCRSTIAPVSDRKEPPPRETYYQWLKRQPEGFQKEVLGPTRATLFRKGGLSAEEFAKLNLGRNFKPKTLEQMKAAAPEVFNRAGVPTD